MTEEHKQQIDDAANKERIYEPKYGGKDRSGYGTLMLYEVNDEREECFENGANFGYNLAESHYQQLLEAEREKVRRLRDGLNELMIGVDGLPPLTAIAGVLEKQYSNAKQLLTDIPE